MDSKLIFFHFNNNQFKWFIYTCIFILNVVKMVMILFLVLMSYRSSFTAKLFYNPSISHSRPFCKIILVYYSWSITFYIMCSCTSSSSYPPSCETNRVPVFILSLYWFKGYLILLFSFLELLYVYCFYGVRFVRETIAIRMISFILRNSL